MPWEQALILLIVGAALVGFVWDRWRYDVVAMACLLACVLFGLIPAADAFSGFGNEATVTVAAVLIVSAAVSGSGALDFPAAWATGITDRPIYHLIGFCVVAAALSALMNNVAALALLMPVALSTSRRFRYSPGYLLMPLSFATLLGGMITLIGTPANLLVSNFRMVATGEPFRLFDFAPAGMAVAAAGIVYLALAGWRHRPQTGDDVPADDAFDVSDYVTELRIGPGSPLIGSDVAAVESGYSLRIAGVVRKERRLFGRRSSQRLEAGDIVLLQAETRNLEHLIGEGRLDLVERETASPSRLAAEQMAEAVVTPQSVVLGSTPSSLDLRERFGVTLLAAARQGRRFEGRLADATLNVGDVLLLEGRPEKIQEVIKALGCLPLAKRTLNLSRRRASLAVGLFALAIVASAFNILSTEVAFTLCVLAMVLLNVIRPSEIYEKVHWPVVVLIGAMIPVGAAIESSGAAQWIAQALIEYSGHAGPRVLLLVVLLATMAITPVLNNPATVIIMAPIVVGLARDLQVSPDPFLMAVVIGASCDFLTPFGHHNNAIVMGAGRYRFLDFVRLGLPLEVLAAAVALAVIPLVWSF